MADNQLVRIGDDLLWLPAVRGIFGEEVRALATINGTNSGNTLNGTNNADTINALGGNDRVNGRGGDDTIIGGTGADRMTGGAGADVFAFAAGDGGTGAHDTITDFAVGTDRLRFPAGASLSTQDATAGQSVSYGGGNDQVQLSDVHGATLTQLTGSDGGGTTPAPQPPPTSGGGGGAPFPTNVTPTYAEEFNTGWGSWYHTWQSEEGVQQTGRGTLLIGGDSRSGSGIMPEPPGNPASGFGDGLYQIRARMEGPGLGSGSGPALVLWPADDRWPGPEIDIGEIGGGNVYMATHWNNGGRDASNIYSAPGVDWRQWHEYAAQLETNRITYYVDGRQIGVETQHPAPEYGEGGVNHIPSLMNRSSETLLEVDYFRFTDESALV